jgi:hypothetical protein
MSKIIKAKVAPVEVPAKEVPANFETTVQHAIKIAVNANIRIYIQEYTKIIAEKWSEKKKWTPNDLIAEWDTLTATTIKKKKVEEAVSEEQQCHYESKKLNARCPGKISLKSKTHKFCGKHYNAQEKLEGRALCNYVPSRGVNEGAECGRVCAVDKEQCSRHLPKAKAVVSKAKKESKAVEIKTGDLKGKFYLAHKEVRIVFDRDTKVVEGLMGKNGDKWTAELEELDEATLEYVREELDLVLPEAEEEEQQDVEENNEEAQEE